MEDALPTGEHMSMETFHKAMSFIERTYKSVKIVMISGGEPTENPLLPEFLKHLDGWNVVVLSNGLFLNDPTKQELVNQILSNGVALQIYNDDRYYPIKVEPIKHPSIVYGDRINLMTPLGRALKNGLKSTRQSPMCFNLRSSARTLRSFSEAVMALRMSGKMCTPSISVNGDVIAGESRFCHKIGTVESSEEELLENLLSISCNKCRLEDGLPTALRNVIHDNSR